MKIQKLHPDLILPTRKTEGSAGYDLYMPEGGSYWADEHQELYGLGFAMQVPFGYGAIIMPRSGVGINCMLEINNTVGLIDSDYTGEIKAKIRTKDGKRYSWEAGERLLQMIIVPVHTPKLEVVDSLDETARGEGGLGSTGR